MTEIQLGIKQARRLILDCQGLIKRNQFGRGKKGVVRTLEEIGYVQLDTISVVSRAHHQTLWNRVGGYDPEMLFSLMGKDKLIFEYWSHAAAFLPMKDYKYTLPRKKEYADGKKHWYIVDQSLKDYVLDRIKNEGPLMSKNFESDGSKKGIWYEWKPAKRALEQLFVEGKVMIAERIGFHKVYNLPERVLPDWVDLNFPTKEEMIEHLIKSSIRAHGVIKEKEIYYLRKGRGPIVRKTLMNLLERGEICEVRIKELPEETFYSTPALIEKMPSRIGRKHIHILCPFDNLLIQRKRTSNLFDFNYTLECYVPAPKRVKGYFSLPILWGDRFVGQLDAKADRKSKVFIVKQLHFEDDVKDIDEFKDALFNRIKEYAEFCGCFTIKIEKIYPSKFNFLPN